MSATKNKAKAIPNREQCKACYLCMSACPVEAISIDEETNNNGYNPIKVDSEKCIGCGACYTICPDYVYEIK